MENLLRQLKEQTKDLKIKYVEKSNLWAKKEYEVFEVLTEKEVIQSFGYYCNIAKAMRHTKASYARWNRIQNIKYNGLEVYLKRKHKEAEEHYEDSIIKLAKRIVKKGLNISEITLKTESCMDKGNISTIITDGKITVTAFTILAWGEINAPHYRYLIK